MFEKVFVVAEAGSNHNGRLETALELVRQAAAAGADAVKFQDFTPHTLYAQAEYARVLGLEDDDWIETASRLALPASWHDPLAREAKRAGIVYFSTPFSTEAVDALDPHVPFFKIASCDITYLPLLERIASKGKGVFLSTGASKVEEIDRAVELLRSHPLPFVCLLHCTMLYPAPDSSLNLNFLDILSERYGLEIGFSDHSTGMEAACAAVAKGIKVLERHFTLDRSQEGADHCNSLEPPSLAELVILVRRVEAMCGPSERVITEREARERTYARRGIYAARDLKKGEPLTLEMLAFLRPNSVTGAERVGLLLGGTLLEDVPAGAPIEERMVRHDLV